MPRLNVHAREEALAEVAAVFQLISEEYREGTNRSRSTPPIHGGAQIGPPLFYRILKQLGITEKEFEQLR